MFLTVSFLTLLLALSITGSPLEVRNSPIIIPLTRSLNFFNGTTDLVQHDKARVAAFRDYNTHGRRAESIPTPFDSFGGYSVEIGVGSPPTSYKLAVASASAVTWIGARTPYDKTGVDTTVRVGETYGGTFLINTVTLGHGLTIPNYALAVASTLRNFGIYEGILGIGPRDLTANTLIDDPPATYSTFTDWLVTAGAIRQNIVGIFFQPITGNGDTNVGELAFGEPDYTKCTSNIIYTDVTNNPRSKKYWGIDQRITYGDTDILLPTAGVIDTGSSFIYITPDAYGRYRAATGATIDQPTGLLRITPDQYNALKDLKFYIGKGVFSLIPNAQIWPRSLNYKTPGAENDGIYLIIKGLGTSTGTGFDFIIGYTFMQRFYTILDRDNRKVGFALTSFTYATTN
ncbi:aspartic peptidase domain-containing protein [Suillus spraguei]|nr:aspartic peptidase domain-containing protein [Suillus spraguei]